MDILERASPEPTYYPYPYSLDPLPSHIKRGLIPLGLFGLLSTISTSCLLGWITYRMISWRKHYRTYVGYNQYVVLIYNLLLADLQQSASFLISFHWMREGRIVAPSSACFAQGWLIQIGDVASGFFVLAIALHTWVSVIQGRKIPYGIFVGSILLCWGFALLLTIIGPAVHKKYFTRAGMWCWASQDYEKERLWLHYIWIFLIEFGTIIIYGIVFFYLRKQLSNILTADQSKTHRKVTQAARYMVVYPIIYVVLTLPLAAGRMASMSGKNLPDVYFVVAGCMITSCGWLDTLLYTLTRRVLLSGDITGNKSNSRSANPNQSGWEITTFDKGGTVNRTVTITGGVAHESRRQFHRADSISLRSASPDGSMDTMVHPTGLGEVKMETRVEVSIEPADSGSVPGSSSEPSLPLQRTPSVRFDNWEK